LKYTSRAIVKIRSSYQQQMIQTLLLKVLWVQWSKWYRS